MSCKQESSTGLFIAALCLCLAVGLGVGYIAGSNTEKPAEAKCCDKPACCEPQRLEITLNVKGEIPVTGSIPVSGEVKVDGEVSGGVKMTVIEQPVPDPQYDAAMSEWHKAMAEWEAKRPKPKAVCK